MWLKKDKIEPLLKEILLLTRDYHGKSYDDPDMKEILHSNLRKIEVKILTLFEDEKKLKKEVFAIESDLQKALSEIKRILNEIG